MHEDKWSRFAEETFGEGATMDDIILHGLTHTMGLSVQEVRDGYVRLAMPVTEDLVQSLGFLHGGATLALLESCASCASMLRVDPDTHYSFGSGIEAKHINSVQVGETVIGEAQLNRTEDLGERGLKEYWDIKATTTEGKLVCTGVFKERIVSKEYFEKRNKEQHA
ncbi:PaaI family thioesterase [Slackia heliotrinireducens]|uniref:PaaI family thioesterase n=1 Tax=Slackia heliotrinireducens TaxID=84110 RepID=UPI003316289E